MFSLPPRRAGRRKTINHIQNASYFRVSKNISLLKVWCITLSLKYEECWSSLDSILLDLYEQFNDILNLYISQ